MSKTMRGLLSSFMVVTLVMSGIFGLMAGANAESEAAIREDFDGAGEIDWEEREQPDNPAIPDEYEQRLNEWEPGILPERVDNAIQQSVRGFTESILALGLWIGESAAVFSYHHRGFFGHWMAQLWLQLAGYSALLGVLGFHIKRVIELGVQD